MPSKGATICLKDCVTSSCRTYAALASMIAFFASAIGGSLIRNLLGDDLLLHERLVALCGDCRDVVIGLGARQSRPGLGELLVQIRGLDRRQHFACLDGCADILAPALQIAVDARVDRGPGIRL